MLTHIKGGGGEVIKRKEDEEKQAMQKWKGRDERGMFTKKLPRETLEMCYWMFLV